ncbi:MAG: choice-of-anchor B family protein, partial [Phaeodactylibacter sp.]|nr:choice-of-anchor B family protein [Phaeodactylibacter sp.]
FNLQNLPTNVTQIYQSTTWFDQAHNIFIDEGSARLYVVGSDAPNGVDVLVFDLAADPEDPTLLASVDLPGNYVHDIYVQEDTAFCSHGFTGLYIYDFSTATSPNLLGTLTTYPEDGYNHSSWLSKDKDFLVFCDESKGKGVKILDVTDLTDLEVPNNQVFRSQLLAPTYTNSVAHNPFIKEDTLFLAYYHDGVQVFDISNPSNVTRIAYYDTEPNNTNYDWWYGAWGLYPFLPSGNIIASDILHGLQILKVGALPVPAELGVFSGELGKDGVLLRWETFSEENTEAFVIEKQAEEGEWMAIGQVPAAGYSNRSLYYQFLDPVVPLGTQYYRLKVLDWDGKVEYSKTIAVQTEGQGLLHIYPSIGSNTGSLHLDYPAGTLLDLQLFDMAGKCVYSGQESGNGSLDLAPLQLPAGTYLLQVQGPGLQHRQRIILNND